MALEVIGSNPISHPTFNKNPDIGVSPSGKARDFDSLSRWFESSHPCQAVGTKPAVLGTPPQEFLAPPPCPLPSKRGPFRWVRVWRADQVRPKNTCLNVFGKNI